MVVYKNRTTRGPFQDEFRTRLKIIHWKQFLLRKICICILFLMALRILYVSRNVQQTCTSDHASSSHLQDVVVYERLELKGVHGALNWRSAAYDMWSHTEVDCIIINCTYLSYHCPRYIFAFIDLTKAFNLVIRKSLFTLLQTMGCPPRKLLRMITSFVGSTSDPLPNQELSKTGLCTRFHTLRHVFLPTAVLRL